MQFYPCQTLMPALDFSAFFILVIGLWFMQFDPQLTIKLLIFFNFTPISFNWVPIVQHLLQNDPWL